MSSKSKDESETKLRACWCRLPGKMSIPTIDGHIGALRGWFDVTTGIARCVQPSGIEVLISVHQAVIALDKDDA